MDRGSVRLGHIFTFRNRIYVKRRKSKYCTKGYTVAFPPLPSAEARARIRKKLKLLDQMKKKFEYKYLYSDPPNVLTKDQAQEFLRRRHSKGKCLVMYVVWCDHNDATHTKMTRLSSNGWFFNNKVITDERVGNLWTDDGVHMTEEVNFIRGGESDRIWIVDDDVLERWLDDVLAKVTT